MNLTRELTRARASAVTQRKMIREAASLVQTANNHFHRFCLLTLATSYTYIYTYIHITDIYACKCFPLPLCFPNDMYICTYLAIQVMASPNPSTLLYRPIKECPRNLRKLAWSTGEFAWIVCASSSSEHLLTLVSLLVQIHFVSRLQRSATTR